MVKWVLISGIATTILIVSLFLLYHPHPSKVVKLEGVVAEKKYWFVIQPIQIEDITVFYYHNYATLRVQTERGIYEVSRYLYTGAPIDPLAGFKRGDRVIIEVTEDGEVVGLSHK